MMQTLFMSATEEREIKTVETVGKQKAGGGGLPSWAAGLARMHGNFTEAHSPSQSKAMFNNYHGV